MFGQPDLVTQRGYSIHLRYSTESITIVTAKIACIYR